MDPSGVFPLHNGFMTSEEAQRALPVVVGAYAAVPSERSEQEVFYERLSGRGAATALEIPFRDGLVDPMDWLARRMVGRFTRSVITLIPGTMQRLGTDGFFGLASPNPDGRRAALDYVRQARDRAEELNQATGEHSVAVIHVHSAPSVTADPDCLADSLDTLLAGETDTARWSTRLVLEHCDAYDTKIPGEKRFLPLDAEINVARAVGTGITINWGRSAVEAHRAERPLEHVRRLVSEGLLEGLMFSGAGPERNDYGIALADAHLPLSGDEPTSLMDSAAVRECMEAAGGTCSYAGAKVQVPAGSSVERRVDIIHHVTRLLTESPTGG